MSAREKLCLTSFVEQGKKFDLYTYDGSLSVPDGVTLRDASEIYPEGEVFTYQSGPGEGSVAVFADFFRYKLLYERGGWWVDTDVVYTGAPVPDDDFYFGRQSPSKITNTVTKLPKESPIAKGLLGEVRSIGKEKASRTWGKTGPKLFTQVLRETGYASEAKPKSYAYPIPWGDAKVSYLPRRREEIEEKLEGSPFFHLWNEILGRLGLQKDVRPPEGSYLNAKAKELGFQWPCPAVQYSADTIEQMAENWEKKQKYADKAHAYDNVRSTRIWKIVTRLNSTARKVKSSLEIQN